jgi:hypothetical protein
MFHLLMKYLPSDLTLRIPLMRKHRRSSGTVRIMMTIAIPTRAGSAESAPGCRRVQRMGSSNVRETDLSKGRSAMIRAGRGLRV